MGRRDDFSQSTIRALSERVGHLCSNPRCHQPTSGPHSNPGKVTRIGKAAHICAASPKGPRYDPKQTKEERRAAKNGIWLCANCADLIDKDWEKYSPVFLHEWKKKAESIRSHAIKASANTPEPAVPTASEQIAATPVVPKQAKPYVCDPGELIGRGTPGKALGLLPAVTGPSRTLVVTTYNGGRILKRQDAESSVTESALPECGPQGFPPGQVLSAPKHRARDGMVWSALNVPREMAFSVAFDGSFAWRERLWEDVLETDLGSRTVGLYTCAHQIVGAVFMSRRLLKFCNKSPRMWIQFELSGVKNRHIALDTTEPSRLGAPKFLRPMTSTEDVLVVGGDFPPDALDEELENFCSELMAELLYFFDADNLVETARYAVTKVVRGLKQPG